MKHQLTALSLIVALVSALVLAPVHTAVAQGHSSFTDIPVTGTVTTTGDAFTGTLDLMQFKLQNGIVAVGKLTGTITNDAGTIIGRVSQTVTLPVNTLQATCTILELSIGEINLMLLGLNVFIDDIFIEITADPSGGILGDLLCALAGLLDLNPDPLAIIVDLLNLIIDVFDLLNP
jgi:hypothetical protein